MGFNYYRHHYFEEENNPSNNNIENIEVPKNKIFAYWYSDSRNEDYPHITNTLPNSVLITQGNRYMNYIEIPFSITTFELIRLTIGDCKKLKENSKEDKFEVDKNFLSDVSYTINAYKNGYQCNLGTCEIILNTVNKLLFEYRKNLLDL